MDLIASAGRLPAPGESVTGSAFSMAPGGKGGNQACQLALCGVATHLITRLGEDLFGGRLRQALADKGVLTDFVFADPGAATGASTVLAGSGDYLSIIVPGAAGRLSREDVDRARPALEACDALVFQLELTVPVSLHAAELARALGKCVILNASPMPDDQESVLRDLLPVVDILVVNRVELAHLSGEDVGGFEQAARATERIRAHHGIATVVATLGAVGSVAAHGGTTIERPGFPVEVVDTVGAGDAFLGAFVASSVRGEPIGAAMRAGAAAGALAVGRAGAYDALPSRDEIERFLADRPADPPTRATRQNGASRQ